MHRFYDGKPGGGEGVGPPRVRVTPLREGGGGVTPKWKCIFAAEFKKKTGQMISRKAERVVGMVTMTKKVITI